MDADLNALATAPYVRAERTASATQVEVADLTTRAFAAYASSDRTCEIGTSRASGHEFRHLIELVEERTR